MTEELVPIYGAVVGALVLQSRAIFQKKVEMLVSLLGIAF